MSGTLQQDFTAITGTDAATSDRYLAAAGWDLERAVSNYFDGIAPPPEVPALNDPTISARRLGHPQPVECRPPPHVFPPPVMPPILPPPPPVDDAEFPVITQLKAGSVNLPLHGLSVVLNVNQHVAEVQILQRFVNMENNPIEAVFTFQQEDVSIYEFYAEIAGKKIASVCKEKQAAFNQYDDAIAQGHGGYLLDKESEDKFKLNVGNLPPFAECIISIKYATVVNTEGDALKLTVPITKVGIVLRGGEVVNWDTKTPTEIPNGLSLRANIQMASPIFGIESETHEIKYDINGNTATLSLAGSPTNQPAKEFTFLVGLQDPHKTASSVVEVKDQSKNAPGQNTAVMLSFYPTIENIDDDDIQMEYVFLVDRSGSMAGSRMTQLINALQLLLRSIPVGSLFNIVGFGSTYERLFPSSTVYDDDSFATATSHAANLKANLISTNILPPLYDILSKPTHAKFPRQLFVLTDGEVENTEQVIAMVKKNIGATRIFTIGIGAEASKRLVKGLARAGKGYAELVNSGVRMEPIVLAQLKRAMQPHLSVEIDWGTLARDIKQAPLSIPPVFPGQAVVVFGMLNRALTEQDNTVMMKLSSPRATSEADATFIPVSLSPSHSLSPAAGSSMVGVLAASAIISDLEKKLEDKQITDSEAKNTIVPLAVKYSLVTKYTSLVAQEVRDDITEGTMQVRTIGELIPPQVQMLTAQDKMKSGAAPAPMMAPAPVGGGRGGGGGGGGMRRAMDPRKQNFKKVIDVEESRRRREATPNEIRKSKRDESLLKKREKRSSPEPQALDYDMRERESSHSLASALSSRRSSSINELMDDSLDEDDEEWESDGDSFSFRGGAPPPPAAAPYGQQQLQQQQANSSFSLFSSHSSPHSSPLSSTPPASAAAGPGSGGMFFSPVTSAPARPDPNKRPLDLFVVLQKASGNWTLTPDFMTIISRSKAQIEAVFGSIDGWIANVVATALAVVYMETKFAESVSEWSMLKDKATRWMTKELTNKKHTESVDQLIQKARQVLQ